MPSSGTACTRATFQTTVENPCRHVGPNRPCRIRTYICASHLQISVHGRGFIDRGAGQIRCRIRGVGNDPAAAVVDAVLLNDTALTCATDAVDVEWRDPEATFTVEVRGEPTASLLLTPLSPPHASPPLLPAVDTL